MTSAEQILTYEIEHDKTPSVQYFFFTQDRIIAFTSCTSFARPIAFPALTFQYSGFTSTFAPNCTACPFTVIRTLYNKRKERKSKVIEWQSANNVFECLRLSDAEKAEKCKRKQEFRFLNVTLFIDAKHSNSMSLIGS